MIFSLRQLIGNCHFSIEKADLKLIETPNTEVNRQRWIERLSMFHWNFEELKSGECWAHMRNYI
jgi:hypothetical protein